MAFYSNTFLNNWVKLNMTERVRTKSEIEEARRSSVLGGCCERFADQNSCDCLERAIEDRDIAYEEIAILDPLVRERVAASEAEYRKREPKSSPRLVAVGPNDWVDPASVVRVRVIVQPPARPIAGVPRQNIGKSKAVVRVCQQNVGDLPIKIEFDTPDAAFAFAQSLVERLNCK